MSKWLGSAGIELLLSILTLSSTIEETSLIILVNLKATEALISKSIKINQP
jgi:hypothetical protein